MTRTNQIPFKCEHARAARERLTHVLNILPSAPGSYTLRDSAGNALYGRKSSNISQSVKRLMSSRYAHTAKICRVLQEVNTIEWEVAS